MGCLLCNGGSIIKKTIQSDKIKEAIFLIYPFNSWNVTDLVHWLLCKLLVFKWLFLLLLSGKFFCLSVFVRRSLPPTFEPTKTKYAKQIEKWI